MSARSRLARRVADLVSSEISPETAYPLRARLGRVVSEAERWKQAGDPLSENPEILQIIDRLTVISAKVMQPSEPFDGRWQAEWAEVRKSAEGLRKLLNNP